MTFETAFAKAILKARKEQGYTQSEVAEAVSVTVRWYQKLESGRRLPGTLTALRLILFLQLDVEELREAVGLVVPISSGRRSHSFQ